MAAAGGPEETDFDALREEQDHPGELTINVASELVKLAEQHAQGALSDADSSPRGPGSSGLLQVQLTPELW